GRRSDLRLLSTTVPRLVPDSDWRRFHGGDSRDDARSSTELDELLEGYATSSGRVVQLVGVSSRPRFCLSESLEGRNACPSEDDRTFGLRRCREHSERNLLCRNNP